MDTRPWVAIGLGVVMLMIVGMALTTKYDEPIKDPVLEAVSDLKADIAKLNDEIAELRIELYEHDNRPEWFERKEDD